MRFDKKRKDEVSPIKMALTASYNAVPSILIVAPTGKMNLVIFLSIFKFSSKHLIVIGNVAALKKKH